MRRKVLDMNLTSGIIEVDLHGLRVEETVKRAKSEVNKASGSVYIIRLIHGTIWRNYCVSCGAEMVSCLIVLFSDISRIAFPFFSLPYRELV